MSYFCFSFGGISRDGDGKKGECQKKVHASFFLLEKKRHHFFYLATLDTKSGGQLDDGGKLDGVVPVLSHVGCEAGGNRVTLAVEEDHGGRILLAVGEALDAVKVKRSIVVLGLLLL